MTGKWMLQVAALPLAIAAGFAATARGDSPWANLLTVNRVEADPNKVYKLEEAHGPWMIMACSFSGPDAEKQAHDLALELRQRYRLEAFVHRMDFKLDDPNGNVQHILASPYRHQYQMVSENPKQFGDGQIKQTAVLVGNFPSIDDPAAQRTLAKLKPADPDCLKPASQRNQSQSLIDWQALRSLAMSQRVENVDGRKLSGPLARAFITRNPLLPDEYFVPKTGVDELVVKMNKNVKYSLLDCPGKYTMQVAHFTGEVILNQGEIQAIENGLRPGPESTKQGLAQAAEKAHDLTEALRLKGWEAYEFHDRSSSVVTVGSFNSVDTQQVDGQVAFKNWQEQRIVEVFGIHKIEEPGRPPEFKMQTMQSVPGVYFDAQPIPIEVPRRSISRQLSQRLETAGE